MSDIDLNTASNKRVNSDFTPVIHEEWWRDNITYSTINRQGIDICTASFVHPTPKGNIIFITGWSETFLKYPEMIKTFYESGYSVYTYDHQSQGLSGRWLPEHQSTWIKSFDDYVDDFIYFVGMIGKNDSKHLSLYCVAHSMGGLVAALAIIKHPSLIKKVVFSAPMFRNKCGMKALEYKFPLPQPLTYWITNLVCMLGLGKQHALGMFKEDPQALITLKLTKDKEQLKNWEALRRKYPRIIASCVTNDWVLQSLIAQEKFSSQYVNFKPKCLVFKATEDIFVYNHAMDQFAKQAPNARIFTVPDSYHELLLEKKIYRDSVISMAIDFFDLNEQSLDNDDLKSLKIKGPIFESEDGNLNTLPQVILKASGIVLAFGLGAFGISIMLSGGKRSLLK